MRGNVRQRAKGTWTLTIELPPDPATGKRRQGYETVRGTKRDALRRLNDLQADVNKGEYVTPGRMTVGSFLDQWLDSHVATTTRATTDHEYVGYARRYIRPKLGHLPLNKLQASHIQEPLADMNQKGLSPQTVRHCRAILKNALGKAVKWGLLHRNPADGTTPPRPDKRKMRALTPDEVELLLSAAQQSNWYMPIFLSLWTGMRRSELLGLRWRDVDLVLGTIHVALAMHRLKGGLTIYEEPKSRWGRRSLPMPPSLTILLRDHSTRREATCRSMGSSLDLDEQILMWPDGRSMLPNSLSHAFSRIAQKAGLTGVRLHDMRHSHASLMLREGVPAKVIQERLGHASISTTMDLYAHLLPGIQEEAAIKFDRAMVRAIPQSTSG